MSRTARVTAVALAAIAALALAGCERWTDGGLEGARTSAPGPITPSSVDAAARTATLGLAIG